MRQSCDSFSSARLEVIKIIQLGVKLLELDLAGFQLEKKFTGSYGDGVWKYLTILFGTFLELSE